jgi:hypothetical protein
MVGTFLAALIALAPALLWRTDWARLLPVVLLLASMLSASAYQMAIILPDFWALVSSPVRTFLTPCLARAERERARVEELSLCAPWHLEFVEQQLKLDAEHLRARWSFMMGPVEKVGTLPGIAATIGSGVTLRSTLLPATAEPWLYCGVAAIAALYIAVACALFVVHRVEHYCVLLSMARKVSERRHEASEN